MDDTNNEFPYVKGNQHQGPDRLPPDFQADLLTSTDRVEGRTRPAPEDFRDFNPFEDLSDDEKMSLREQFEALSPAERKRLLLAVVAALAGVGLLATLAALGAQNSEQIYQNTTHNSPDPFKSPSFESNPGSIGQTNDAMNPEATPSPANIPSELVPGGNPILNVPEGSDNIGATEYNLKKGL